MAYRFGDCVIDPERGELSRAGRVVAVQPKPFALLVHLVAHRDRVVPKEELLETLWPDAVVTDSSLTRAVSLARKALGEGAGERLRSVARRGYRFVGDVVETEIAEEALQRTQATTPRTPADPFVGREVPLATLRSAWQASVEGTGAVVWLTGPPGIGKTRVLEAFAAELRAAGRPGLGGREDDSEGAPPFWLWVQLLRALAEVGRLDDALATLDAGAAAELEPLLPHPAGEETRAPARATPTSEEGRFVLFDAVARVFVAAARAEPLVLLLEDVHWSGRASLLLLEHLIRELQGVPLLVVATVRDEPREPGHPLTRTLSNASPLPHVTSIELTGFSRDEVAELLAERLERPAPDLLVDELLARTEGNPLYVGEGMRLLADRGALDFPELHPGWSLDLLPRRTGDLVARHLESLSPEALDALQGAAVLGREIRLPLLARLGEQAPGDVLDALDEAVHAGLLVAAEGGAGTYRFAHPLYQEVTYGALAPGRRARLHQRIGELLDESSERDSESRLTDVAHHLHLGLVVGDPARACEVALRAAERASQVLAWEQAALHYEQALAALEHMEPIDPDRQLEVLLRLGEAHRFAGERTRRRGVLGRALALARSLERNDAFARGAITFCDLSEWSPRDDEGLRVLEEALDASPGHAPIVRARLLTRIAYLNRRERSLGEPAAREAVAIGREADDPDTLQEALYTLHLVLSGPDGLAERRALIPEAAEAAARGSYRDLALIGLVDLAADWLHEGERAESLRARAVAEEFAGTRPHRGMRWHLDVFDAGLALLEGRYDDAERGIREHLLLGRMIEHPYAGLLFAGQTIGLLRDRGQLSEIGRRIPSLQDLSGGSAPVNLAARVTSTGVLAAFGELQPARDLVAEAVTPALSDVPREHWWTPAVVGLADLVARLGDVERATILRDALAPWPHLHSVTPMPILYGGPVSRSLGLMEFVLGDLDAAAKWFERAELQTDALAARPMRARVQLARGQVLRRMGAVEVAEAPLRAAAAGAAEIGLAGVGEEAGAALQGAEIEEEIAVKNW